MSIKICFLICGLPRTIDMVINNIEEVFSNTKYIINYIICISKNNDETNSNKLDLNTLIENDKIRRIIIIENDSDNSFKNCINYSKKIKVSIENVDKNYDIYDIYIIIRSDFIFINDDFIESIEDSNQLYFSNKFNDIKDINIPNNKINEYIIIAKKYEVLKKIINFHDYCIDNNNFCNINLYKFIYDNKYDFNLIQIDYKLILSRCNILAISGDSGSGKTTLMKYLLKIYNKTNVLKLETDRYHKWERGDINYEKYTHLNPNANYLEMMSEDIYNLKIGNNIYQVDYDHNSGKFTDKQKITANENIILCGLHTLYNTKLNDIIDIKIFMDTDRELIKKWKINRDTNERGYTMEKILNQIEKRNNDYFSYIYSQCENADIIINYYENNGLQCNLKIKNKNIINSLYKYFIKYNYIFELKNDILIVELKNSFSNIYTNENINTKFPDIILDIFDDINNYYNEILIFLILYLFE
jgi:uridine kinase